MCWPGMKGEGVESQNRRCLEREVTVLKAWPHLWHFICILKKTGVSGGTADDPAGLPAVSVHPLVPAQVRELRVALEANLAAERLDTAVNVRVLL